jgi:hypothetical protein
VAPVFEDFLKGSRLRRDIRESCPIFPMRLAAFMTALLLWPSASAADCVARSGPAATALLELYTSEGCNSCPPADRWLSRLEGAGFDSSRLVALAFHVDYWDYIGWKDRFANPAWSERQRSSVRQSGGRFVYTPQVMLNGRDFPSWAAPAAFSDAIASANARSSPAKLTLHAARNSGELLVFFDAALVAGLPSEHAVFLALTESRLTSVVRAGENKGATLEHDHVVRSVAPVGNFDSGGRRHGRHAWTLAASWRPEQLAVTAFVQNTRTGEAVQAVRLALCAP